MVDWQRSWTSIVRRGLVIYPFLFAVFPILFLWARNVGELALVAEPLEILIPLAIAVGLTGLALVLVGRILRDIKKAGLLLLLFLLSFYSYGHVYKSLESAGIGDPSRQWFFFGAWACISVLAGVLILRIRFRLWGLTHWLNIITGILVIIPLANIGGYTLGSLTDLIDHGTKLGEALHVDVSDTETLPDIYYIVPDSYSNSRTLRELGHDNRYFTDYLTARGFFVASESYSNYMYTELSLASSLNMQYLSEIDGAMPGEKRWPSFLYRHMIDGSRVFDSFRSLGYTLVITREKGVYTRDGRSQIFCDRSSAARILASDFSGALLSTTALYPVTRAFNVVERQAWNQALCDFSVIVDAKDIEGPKFVYAHLKVPHPPYIFGRDGLRDPQSLSDTDYLDPREYVDQVVFVNKKLRTVVDELLSGSGRPPIIIIQADHGTRASQPKSHAELYRARFGILNAYHLPGGGNQLLGESISPVNTFRVIFNHYFGADYELLADRSYYTDRPFAGSTHQDVTALLTE